MNAILDFFSVQTVPVMVLAATHTRSVSIPAITSDLVTLAQVLAFVILLNTKKRDNQKKIKRKEIISKTVF